MAVSYIYIVIARTYFVSKKFHIVLNHKTVTKHHNDCYGVPENDFQLRDDIELQTPSSNCLLSVS